MDGIQALNIEFLEVQKKLELVEIEILQLEKIKLTQNKNVGLSKYKLEQFENLAGTFEYYENTIQQYTTLSNQLHSPVQTYSYTTVFAKQFLENSHALKFKNRNLIENYEKQIKQLCNLERQKQQTLDFALKQQQVILEKISQIPQLNLHDLDVIEMNKILKQQQSDQYQFLPSELIINNRLDLLINDLKTYNNTVNFTQNDMFAILQNQQVKQNEDYFKDMQSIIKLNIISCNNFDFKLIQVQIDNILKNEIGINNLADTSEQFVRLLKQSKQLKQ
ncbi:hypothetical protein SS50377_23678 [Spironucleus salmonicida]|uniref:Uncharacterized protein n=1 Tax=Spironucleus salmonicida TaxID=348837 RepID=V6LY87_9EUKA|nr:hypothetical protein SS50377_23678 [Spironucleus salmonicida]|eukprot:EST48661.1 Hypothetical protein SS50377_11274 [Spironucleus salmonicida]